MACLIRASGTDFDVDAFVSTSVLTACSIWRRGETRFPQVDPGGERHGTSGLRILVSQAAFSDLGQQISGAIKFLRQCHDAVRLLSKTAGVTSVVLDFGVEISPPYWSAFTFPPELLSLAGSAGVAVCLSVYPVDSEVIDV